MLNLYRNKMLCSRKTKLSLMHTYKAVSIPKITLFVYKDTCILMSHQPSNQPIHPNTSNWFRTISHHSPIPTFFVSDAVYHTQALPDPWRSYRRRIMWLQQKALTNIGNERKIERIHTAVCVSPTLLLVVSIHMNMNILQQCYDAVPSVSFPSWWW